MRIIWLVCFLLLLPTTLLADEIRPAFLQLSQLSEDTFAVYFRVPARGDNQRLSLQVEFDPLTQNKLEPVGSFVADTHSQRWLIQRPNGLTGAEIKINGLAKTASEVLLRIVWQNDTITTARLTPNSPTYIVQAQASTLQVSWTYFVLGVEHILFGIDHILFVFVLLLLVRNLKKLVATITAFTLAHSITLILASLGLLHIPIAPVEACIALSIVFIAAEIIHGQQGRPGLTERYPWIVAFSFGLLHGLGFAAALGEIGLPQNAIVTALLVFNLGVEAGQLLFVLAVVGIGWLLQHFSITVPIWLQRLPPYIIGSLAMFWVFERISGF